MMFKLDKWTPLFVCLSTIPLEVAQRDPWQATGFLGLSVRELCRGSPWLTSGHKRDQAQCLSWVNRAILRNPARNASNVALTELAHHW